MAVGMEGGVVELVAAWELLQEPGVRVVGFLIQEGLPGFWAKKTWSDSWRMPPRRSFLHLGSGHCKHVDLLPLEEGNVGTEFVLGYQSWLLDPLETVLEGSA